jgi:MFS family permease
MWHTRYLKIANETNEQIAIWQDTVHESLIPDQLSFSRSGDNSMETSIYSSHLLITLGAWIGGMLVGGGLGSVFASMLLPAWRSNPGTRRALALIPWRTAIFGLLLGVWSPFFLPLRLGLGTLTGLVAVGLSVGLIAFPMMVCSLYEFWFPLSARERAVSGARTLLFIAMLAALATGLVGGGGAGAYLAQQVNLLNQGDYLRWMVILIATALALDLILGFLEYGMYQNSEVESRRALDRITYSR